MLLLYVAMMFAATLQGEDYARLSVAELLHRSNGSDSSVRLAATAELFARGPAVLASLEAAGARPMRTVSPTRGDVIYSLLHGRLDAPDSSGVFGIHFERAVTRKEAEQIGLRRGFRLEPSNPFQPGASPTCYVRLSPGQELAAVLRNLLLSEPSVITVNFNYVEQ